MSYRALAIALTIALAGLSLAGNLSEAAATAGAEFSIGDRTLIAEYRVLGKELVPLVIAADPARTGLVVRAIEAAGGRIVSRQDDIGYLYVEVPIKTVGGIPRIAGIDAVQVDCNPVRSEAADDPEAKPKKPATPPTPFMALDNPFTAEYATQASILKKAHPSFDGRGVVVGFVEPADPTLPSMKGALDLHGLPVDKFAVYTWGDPATANGADSDGDGSAWQRVSAVTPDLAGHFSFEGRNYRLPDGVSAKQWYVCVRRPLPTVKAKSYVVLWATDLGRIWVLESEQEDFSAAPSAIEQSSLAIVTRDYDAKVRESRTWVFKVDAGRHLLGFRQVYAAHASMVASVIAGNSFLGSRAGGVAPASQLAVFQAAYTRARPSLRAIDDHFAALRDKRVDIVESSEVVGDTVRGTSQRVYGLLMDRLVRLTGKPLAAAAGNYGPRLERIAEFRTSDGVFTIGGYVPRETWRAHSGFEPSADFTPAEYSNWGPATDGGLKPDFLALTQTLCESNYRNAAYEEPFGLYTVSGGTSAAGPNAAGNIALLVSAAKQTGIKYDQPRLRAAIATTAKFLPGVEARTQGYGVIQVSDAWEALNRANSWDPVQITASAPVVGAEGGAASTGRGLFEISGWTPGMTGTRNITLTRTSGPS